MAITPITAWGRLNIPYTFGGKSHTVDLFCREVDYADGLWQTPGQGSAGVDSTVTAFQEQFGLAFPNGSQVTFGDVLVQERQPDGSYLDRMAIIGLSFINGTGAGTYPQPFNQVTWVFRDTNAKIVKFAAFGQGIYSASSIRSLAGLGAISATNGYRGLAELMISPSMTNIVSRSNANYAVFKSASWGENERLRKEYDFV